VDLLGRGLAALEFAGVGLEGFRRHVSTPWWGRVRA
jgi:hypothetical protein